MSCIENTVASTSSSYENWFVFVCFGIVLKGTCTWIHINPSVVIGLSSSSDVTQCFTLVLLKLSRQEKKQPGSPFVKLHFNETLRKLSDTQCDTGTDFFKGGLELQLFCSWLGPELGKPSVTDPKDVNDGWGFGCTGAHGLALWRRGKPLPFHWALWH